MRVGFTADLLVVNGNPLENLRLLNPAGTDVVVNGQVTRGGGVEWTIKDGIPYHGPTLMAEVREMVDEAGAEAQDDSVTVQASIVSSCLRAFVIVGRNE